MNISSTVKKAAGNKYVQMAAVAVASFMIGGGTAKAVEKRKKK